MSLRVLHPTLWPESCILQLMQLSVSTRCAGLAALLILFASWANAAPGAVSRTEYALLVPQPASRVSHPPVRDDDEPREGSRSKPVVPGNRAIVRAGIAYAPTGAPEPVKRAIWATNSICRKPYRFGGGHHSFEDRGYDCSGTVSFALHHAGILDSPMDSRSFLNFGKRGKGRWITVYTRRGHAFAVIAGARLDTTGARGDEGPRWHADDRAPWGFEARHPENF